MTTPTDRVLVYIWDLTTDTGQYTEAVVAHDTSVNVTASARFGGNAREMLVNRWNELHPEDPRTDAGFEWADRPEGWVNPNEQPGDTAP